MKRIILATLLLASTLVLNGCGEGSSSETETGRYESAEIGFDYPVSWTMRESDTPLGKVIILYAPSEENEAVQTNLNVIVQDLSNQEEAVTLESYTNLSKESLPDIVEGLTILNEGSRKLDGQDGFEISYKGTTKTNPNKVFQWWQAWTVTDGKAYILTLTSNPERIGNYTDVAENVAQSLEIK